jgi:Cys-tRNA(Pro)/Cys-tRNA(Cys) deacylase
MHPRIKKILDESGVAYRVHFHRDMPVPIRTPQDFASALNYDAARITKTLLLRATDGDTFVVAVLSCHKRLDMKRTAATVEAAHLGMADEQELKRVLDYPRHGVSPVGAVGARVLMDETLFAFPTILIGAGEAGVEIEISPETLRELTGAESLPLS